MKRSNFVIILTILGSLLTISPVVFQTKAFAAQELESVNLGCTQNLRTVLRQQSPDYCRSAEADSGVLFDQFKVTRNSDRSINLEFRVFNRGSADALVEVYDSGGRLRDIKIIDGNKPPTGLIQSGGDLFTKVPASLFSRYPLGDARRDLKEQNIIMTIPAGGSVKITKSSNFAVWYNNAMLAVEIAQLAQGDPEFTRSETTKQLVREFAKEFGTQTAINIFKGEPSLQSAFSLDFIDKDRLGAVLQKLVQYTATIESDPSKNPILGAFSDVYLTGANYGLETAIDKYIFPGLGTVARRVRIGGSAVNTFARAADLRNAMIYGQRATVTLRDAVKGNQSLISKIDLISEENADYSALRALLADKKWQEADQETLSMILEVARRRGLSWERGKWDGERSNISRFPCSDLRTIDQLWRSASQNRFGFSVKNKIWEDLGGAVGPNQDSSVALWNSYNEIIGTRVNGRGLSYSELNFSTFAPRGHLPALASGYNIDFSIMRIAAANCGLR